jgi:hypothetical protein
MGTTEKWKHVIFVCDMFEDRIGFKQALEYDCVMKKKSDHEILFVHYVYFYTF